MVLTTSAVWAPPAGGFKQTGPTNSVHPPVNPRLQSFFVKRWCYVDVEGEPKRVESCICMCVPEDRIRAGQFCKRCSHWVHSDEVYIPVPANRPKRQRR